jgi:hypothetical protein
MVDENGNPQTMHPSPELELNEAGASERKIGEPPVR